MLAPHETLFDEREPVAERHIREDTGQPTLWVWRLGARWGRIRERETKKERETRHKPLLCMASESQKVFPWIRGAWDGSGGPNRVRRGLIEAHDSPTWAAQSMRNESGIEFALPYKSAPRDSVTATHSTVRLPCWLSICSPRVHAPILRVHISILNFVYIGHFIWKLFIYSSYPKKAWLIILCYAQIPKLMKSTEICFHMLLIFLFY